MVGVGEGEVGGGDGGSVVGGGVGSAGPWPPPAGDRLSPGDRPHPASGFWRITGAGRLLAGLLLDEVGSSKPASLGRRSARCLGQPDEVRHRGLAGRVRHRDLGARARRSNPSLGETPSTSSGLVSRVLRLGGLRVDVVEAGLLESPSTSSSSLPTRLSGMFAGLRTLVHGEVTVLPTSTSVSAIGFWAVTVPLVSSSAVLALDLGLEAARCELLAWPAARCR